MLGKDIEHVYLFIQKIPEKPCGIVEGTVEKCEFNGEYYDGKHTKNKTLTITGTIKGKYKAQNTRKVRDEKKSIIDSIARPYEYVDKVNYNTSIAEAVFHHININSPKDNFIKFDKIINIFDNKSKDSNDVTYKKLENYVNGNIDDSKIEINIDELSKSSYRKKDYDYDQLLGRILTSYKFKEGSKVYIATNGGPRDMMMFISTLAQILSHKNIESFMYYEDSNGVVSNQKVSYYNLLRAVDLFIETGNPNKLSFLYKDEPELKEFIKKMNLFNEKIQVCRKVDTKDKTSSTKIDNSEEGDESELPNASIQLVYRKLISEIDKLSKSENIPSTLALVLPDIKKAFVNVEWDENRNRDLLNWDESMLSNPEELDILNIVKWCHDNNLITIGYFIFRVEMTNFICRCKGFLEYTFVEAKNLPNYQKIMNSNKKKKTNNNEITDNSNLDDENLDYSMLVSHMLRYANTKNDESERLDALMILFSSYIYDKLKNDEDLNKYEMDNLIDAYKKRVTEIKKDSLKEFGLLFDESKTEEIYNLIMRCNLIRRIRNTLAHSDNKSLIGGVYSYLKDIVYEYERKLREKRKEGLLPGEIEIDSLFTEGYDIKTIESGSKDYYKVCHVLLGFLYEDMYEHYKNTRGDTK